MAEKITIDDSIVTVANAPRVVYTPPNQWRQNEFCLGCNITAGPVTNRVRSTASGGTWTVARWPEQGNARVLTATLEFQGSDVATYFIVFFRSGDPDAKGDSTLMFYIDNELKQTKQMVASDYTFQNDFTRERLFSASDLDPNSTHVLRIQLQHTVDIRPPVVVALDSIEYTGTLPKSDGPDDTITPDSSSSSKGSSSSNLAKIVAPTVVAVVLLLALLGILLRWYWVKRQKRRSKLRWIDPDTAARSEMTHIPHSNWNATLYNRPDSLYLDQPSDGRSAAPSTGIQTAATAATESIHSPPPYTDNHTSTTVSHLGSAGESLVPPQHPGVVTKSRLHS